MRMTLTAVVLALALPATASAQSVEVQAGYAGWSGDEFEGFDAGPRIRASILGSTGGSLEIGATGSWARTPVDTGNDDITQLGLGVTARKALGVTAGPHVYVEGHLGWTRLSQDAGVVDVQESGFAVGPGLGVAIPLGGVQLTLSSDIQYQSYGDLEIEGGLGVGEAGQSGWRWGAQAGLALGR